MSIDGEKTPTPHKSRRSQWLLDWFDRESEPAGHGPPDQPARSALPDQGSSAEEAAAEGTGLTRDAQQVADAVRSAEEVHSVEDSDARPETAPVIDGQVISDEELAAARLQPTAEHAVAAYGGHLSPAARTVARKQVAEFAELAHRLRVPSLAGYLAIGSGEGITSTVVRAMAHVILRSESVPGLVMGQEDLTDLLMRALVVPAEPEDLSNMHPSSFASWRGRIMLDLTATADGLEPPSTLLVRPGDRPEQWGSVVQTGESAGDEVRPESATAAESAASYGDSASSEAEGQGAREGNHEEARRADPEWATQTAVVISGSATAIADGRRYLSLEALTSYARREVFHQNCDYQKPETASVAMRAARNLEIVVLLDPSLGGGVWVDVDPDTGLPVAALAIGLPNLAQLAGVRVTHLAGT